MKKRENKREKGRIVQGEREGERTIAFKSFLPSLKLFTVLIARTFWRELSL